MTASDVAKLACISRARFYQLCNTNKGPPIGYKINNIAHYNYSDVDKWLMAREATVLKHTYDKDHMWFLQRKTNLELAKILTFVHKIQKVASVPPSDDDVLKHVAALNMF